MINLRKKLTISQLITFGPILVVLALSLVLGISRYQSEYDSAIHHELQQTRAMALPILSLVDRNIGGDNYANMLGDEALALFSAYDKLLYLKATGKTDVAGNDYGIIYDRPDNHVIRATYPASYLSEIEAKISKIEERMAGLSEGHRLRPKLEKMLAKNKALLDEYAISKQHLQEELALYPRPSPVQLESDHFLNRETWQLHLIVPTGNKNGGEMWMVMDASDLGHLWQDILMEVLPINLAGLLIAVFLMWLLARTIINPIQLLVKDIDEVERNSDLTTRMAVRGKDEISQIATSLNNMLEKFQNILKEVDTSTTQVAAATEEMSRTLQDSTAGIEQQKNQTDQLATAASEMSATVSNVAQNATEASTAASRADKEAQQGAREVVSTVNSINTLASEVETAAEVINKLNQDSDNIGSVLDVIMGIAEQTNLLALNAAIEAARAGEQGRGFAVVADEVRTLASRTQNSAQEIETMIKGLQSSTGDAVQAMDAGTKQAQSCVEQAQRAGTALQTITEMVATISAMNEQIASAAEQQTAVTEEMTRNAVSIDEIADSNACHASQCAASSAELSRLAIDLQTKVGKFKI